MRPTNDQPDPRTPADGRLLRAAADGELSPEDRRALDARTGAERADDEARIAFEQSLRDAVGRALGGASASPGDLDALQARIESAWARECAPDRPVRRIGGWLIPVAAAAALLLTLTSFLAVQWFGGMGPGPDGLGERWRLVSRLDGEHERCSVEGRAFESKMTTRSPERADEAIAGVLGPEARTPDLRDAGLAFVGLGRCTAAGFRKGVQIIYRPMEPGLGPAGAVSVFVSRDDGAANLLPGESIALVREASPETPPILVWRDGEDGLLYYLVTERDEPYDAARTALGAPASPTSVEVVGR